MITANLFIDWDSASRVSRVQQSQEMPLQLRASWIKQAYSDLQERIIDKLSEIEKNTPIKILRTRIYHGWHKGRQPTEDMRAWETVKLELKGISRNKVSYLSDIEFGNELICRGHRSKLYDTLRPSFNKPGSLSQKMVDTALVSDLLSYCRSESSSFRRNEKPTKLAIVVGDDDDLLPGVFVAEAWGLPIYVFRITRDHDNKFLNTDGIIHRI
ncbi:hypothetical protein CFBP1590__5175 [Pseudomonas viridiflava]|uniref:NYN domain-containing protein n=1 Tax=Pseudomonas viridiflava TaxID=33069 RepID=A0A1Y6JUI2_PSEVI|nr:hypothetical protein CFBP1590__5175 [Pseudomonas viridiflava]